MQFPDGEKKSFPNSPQFVQTFKMSSVVLSDERRIGEFDDATLSTTQFIIELL